MSPSAKHPILIVDDEPDILLSLKGLLRRDFELHTAESGEQALEILRDHSIHVIMTDQRMPGMTGVELMNQAKIAHPEAVRIVFTGYADIKAVVEAINTGGLFRYITKPWDPDELIEVLHEAANRYDEDIARIQFAEDMKSFVNEVTQRATALASVDGNESDMQSIIDQGTFIVTRLDVML